MRGMHAIVAVAGSSVLLVGCSGTEPEVVSEGTGGVTEPVGTDADALDTGEPADAGDAPAVITVDGTVYPIPNFMGGKCHTTGDPARNQDLAVYGFSEQGPRVEISFTQQAAESSQSGEDEYHGLLSIGSGAEGPWTVRSTEPWPWLEGDRSSVSGSVTMADRDGNEVEVEFDVTCP